MQNNRTIVGHNQDEEHFAASINKIPIALLLLDELRAGNLTTDQIITWQPSDQRGGFGLYDQPGAPLQGTVQDLLFDMLNRSGNTVVRAFVNYTLDGPEAVNQRFAEKPGLTNTYLMPLGGGSFYLGNSTARDSLWAINELLATNDQYQPLVKDMLATNIFTDFGVRTQLSNNKHIVLANKIGALNDPDGNNRHDVGVIYNTKTHKRYGYSFFTTSPYDDVDATTQAENSLKKMGGYTLHYAGDKQKQGSTMKSLKQQTEKRIRF